MLHFLRAFNRVAFLPVMAFYLAGIGLEWLAGRKSPTWRFNCFYTVFFRAFNFTAVVLFSYQVTLLIEKIPFQPLRIFEFSDRGNTAIGILLAVAYAALVRDFFYYWFHRLQHTSKWLWQQHAVHHSDECMNITTGFRHHWLEHILEQIFIFAPMAVLFKPPAITIAAAAVVVEGIGYFEHLNLPISLGWAFASPATHRIHHSSLPKHCDKNFAAVLPIWDVLFGTYCAPEPGVAPPTGLLSGERINSFSDALWWPFKKWKTMIAVAWSRKATGSSSH